VAEAIGYLRIDHQVRRRFDHIIGTLVRLVA
jgi:hypothetical protein